MRSGGKKEGWRRSRRYSCRRYQPVYRKKPGVLLRISLKRLEGGIEDQYFPQKNKAYLLNK
jgi:hypothetical protein